MLCILSVCKERITFKGHARKAAISGRARCWISTAEWNYSLFSLLKRIIIQTRLSIKICPSDYSREIMIILPYTGIHPIIYVGETNFATFQLHLWYMNMHKKTFSSLDREWMYSDTWADLPFGPCKIYGSRLYLIFLYFLSHLLFKWCGGRWVEMIQWRI